MNNPKKKFLDKLDRYHSQLSQIDLSALENHLHFIKQLDKIENKPSYILDLKQQDFLFVSNKYKHLLGLPKTNKEEIDFDFFLQRIHPQDHSITQDTPDEFLKFIQNQPIGKRYDYKLITDFRLKMLTGKYLRVIEQINVLHSDNQGIPWLIMGICDASTNQNVQTPPSGKIINNNTGKTVVSIGNTKSLFPATTLTKRETEILKLISQGYLSKEIAEQLHISINTVNNHRRNILKKTDCNNSFETMKFVANNGLD